MSLIEFHHVSKEYLSEGVPVLALDDVSIEFEAGEFAAIVGRSGGGKSTLLNLAGAMDFPTAGEVRIDGQSTSSMNDAGLTRLRRERIGFIFQSFQLLPTLSVLENVELPLLLAGVSDARTPALAKLRDVEMESYANRMPYQLSGGQMQRVAIARALVHGPRVLLADEPTGNLDTATGNVILDLLRRIAASGTAVLMATHSAEAAASANTLVRLRDGRVAEVTRAAAEHTCPR